MPEKNNAEAPQVEDKANQEAPGQEAPNQEAPGQEATKHEAGSSDNGAGAPQNEEGFDTLPEHWRKEISSLRKEAASRRTQKNELETQLQEIQKAGDPAEQKKLISQLQSDLEKSQLEATRAQIARDAKLPLTYDVLLTGDTPELLKQQAAALAQISSGSTAPLQPLPKPQQLDPTGGRNPNDQPPARPKDLLAKAKSLRSKAF